MGSEHARTRKVATHSRHSIGTCLTASAEDAGGRRSKQAVAKQTTNMNLKSLMWAMIEAWRVTGIERRSARRGGAVPEKVGATVLQHTVEEG